MKIIDGIPVFGTEVDEGALRQIKTCAQTADKVALMADHHKGYAVPIGGVVAYKESISPSGVGFDIACGNKAVLLDMPGPALRANIGKIMDDVFQTISFGVGRRNAERADHTEPSEPTSIGKSNELPPDRQAVTEILLECRERSPLIAVGVTPGQSPIIPFIGTWPQQQYDSQSLRNHAAKSAGHIHSLH